RPLYISKKGKWYTGDYLMNLEHYQDLDKIEKNGTPCTFAWNDLGQPVLHELSQSWFSKPNQIPVYAILTAFHGSDGENGSFQGICESFNIPYTGSGVLGSALGMDKVTAKTVCKAKGIPVVEDVHFFEKEWIEKREQILLEISKFSWPVVVKPVHLGSSIGVTVTKNRNELVDAIELAFRYDEHVLVEKAIQPLTEINCSVLGTPENNRASVCERPLGKSELLSFEDKYMSDGESGKGMASADRIIPADISEKLTGDIQATAKEVFRTFRASGLARLDFLVNSDTNEFFFNEINTIPGSFSFYLWEKSETGFTELLLELLDLAVGKYEKKRGRIQSYETNLLSQKAVKGLKGSKAINDTT
ncbi:MAG: D-alanine--D-alanine ligase, partial [Balneolaceae bacterium]